jgi:steroid 5-alpha reductase family enzyme
VRVAFLTAALAAGFAAAVLAVLPIWLVTLVSGSSEPWAAAAWVVPLVAVGFAAATYLAERIAHRRTLARLRATGEPWAFREDA